MDEEEYEALQDALLASMGENEDIHINEDEGDAGNPGGIIGYFQSLWGGGANHQEEDKKEDKKEEDKHE